MSPGLVGQARTETSQQGLSKTLTKLSSNDYLYKELQAFNFLEFQKLPPRPLRVPMLGIVISWCLYLGPPVNVKRWLRVGLRHKSDAGCGVRGSRHASFDLKAPAAKFTLRLAYIYIHTCVYIYICVILEETNEDWAAASCKELQALKCIEIKPYWNKARRTQNIERVPPEPSCFKGLLAEGFGRAKKQSPPEMGGSP